MAKSPDHLSDKELQDTIQDILAYIQSGENPTADSIQQIAKNLQQLENMKVIPDSAMWVMRVIAMLLALSPFAINATLPTAGLENGQLSNEIVLFSIAIAVLWLAVEVCVAAVNRRSEQSTELLHSLVENGTAEIESFSQKGISVEQATIILREVAQRSRRD